MYILLGPSITFYAIVFLRQWRVVRLTPTFSCIASASEGRDRKALYAAFFGASRLLERIEEDAKRIMRTPSLIELRDPSFPYISELTNPNAPEEVCKFEIHSLCYPARDDRLLYFAKTSDGRSIILKFARRYSIELHLFCAERGHAPNILGFQRLPGDWCVVAMEHISKSVHPSESPHLGTLYKTWIRDLEKLVQSFHSVDLVHGDLREPNIICNGETVMLIDFDWGGRVGDARYPSGRLSAELTDGRTSTSPSISKDDDRRVLQNTLKRIEAKACM